jgi:hypothetical protein
MALRVQAVLGTLKCDPGHVERDFGGVQWQAFGRRNWEALVFVPGSSLPGSSSQGLHYRALTRPAYAAITALSADDYRAFHREALH